MKMTGAEAVARLPSSIRIGPYDYALERLSDSEADRHMRWGDCWPGRYVIRIAPLIPTAAKAVNTLVHEALHAIFDAMNIEDGDKEERLVTAIGNGLSMLYRDNPWLMAWIAESLA